MFQIEKEIAFHMFVRPHCTGSKYVFCLFTRKLHSALHYDYLLKVMVKVWASLGNFLVKHGERSKLSSPNETSLVACSIT